MSSPIISTFLESLTLRQTICTSHQLRITSAKRLRPSTNSLQDLRPGQPLFIREIGDKIPQIALEALDLGGSHKAEDVHRPVLAIRQVPVRAGERNRHNGFAGCRDGTRAPECRKPDHDLVLRGRRGSRRRKDIVCYVGDDGRPAVRPCPCRGQRFDGRDGYLGDLGYDVRVRFHVAGTAGLVKK